MKTILITFAVVLSSVIAIPIDVGTSLGTGQISNIGGPQIVVGGHGSIGNVIGGATIYNGNTAGGSPSSHVSATANINDGNSASTAGGQTGSLVQANADVKADVGVNLGNTGGLLGGVTSALGNVGDLLGGVVPGLGGGNGGGGGSPLISADTKLAADVDVNVGDVAGNLLGGVTSALGNAGNLLGGATSLLGGGGGAPLIKADTDIAANVDLNLGNLLGGVGGLLGGLTSGLGGSGTGSGTGTGGTGTGGTGGSGTGGTGTGGTSTGGTGTGGAGTGGTDTGGTGTSGTGTGGTGGVGTIGDLLNNLLGGITGGVLPVAESALHSLIGDGSLLRVLSDSEFKAVEANGSPVLEVNVVYLDMDEFGLGLGLLGG